MKNIFGCVRIFLLEQLREPIGIFWSFIAPVCFLALSDSARVDSFAGSYPDQIGWCLSYIAMTTSLFGFGLYLVGRRESGFVRSFLTSSSRRGRFFVAQYAASLTMALVYGMVFIILASAFVKQILVKDAILHFGVYAIVCSFFMFGSTIVVALPLTFKSTSSLLSIAVAVALVAGISASTSLSYPSALGLVNPFSLGAKLISGNLHENETTAAIFMHSLIILLLGIFGITKQRINPQWSNRQ